MATQMNNSLLAARVLDILQRRAAWSRRPVVLTLDELRGLLFSRFSSGGRPTVRQIKSALRLLRGRVHVTGGKVFLRG